MPPFLFKILAIVAGIVIWKSVASSFAKAKKAMQDETFDDDAEDAAAPQATVCRNEQWRLAAQQLACAFDPGKRNDGGDVSISGNVSGHAVTVKRFGHNYVRYSVAFRRPLQSRVCVVRDLEPIAKRILDGRPVFSSKLFFSAREPVFFCSADSEDAFDRFLDVPSNRSAVLNLVHAFPAGMFNADGVSVRIRATTPDAGAVRQMIAVADALESPSGSRMPDLTAAPKKDLISVPPVPSFPLSPPPAAAEEDVPKRFPPIQIEEEYRRRDASARMPSFRTEPEPVSVAPSPEPFDPAAAPEIPSPEPFAPVDSEQVPVTPAVRENELAEPVVQAQTSFAADSGLDVESVCAVLFAKSFPGAEERAAFDAMKGRRVRWSGELQMSLPFSMDFTFGSRRGVKATLLVCRMAQGQSGMKVPIKAVAAFPPELRAALEAAKGKTVVFSGEILKFESFAREIYLQDARLEA